MAHECFENAAIADFMNEHFVNIKLDREERPDVDRLYMAALHAMGEQGGWPLTMFLTPDLHPFWGGTYFPPTPRHGRPGFLQVLNAISNLWTKDRHHAQASGKALTQHLNKQPATSQTELPDPEKLSEAASIITKACDLELGGLRGAPKFPQAPMFAFLWQQGSQYSHGEFCTAVQTTLLAISQGGIYDHLAGGIARYSTDPYWLVPHFEKMLCDNAQYIGLATRVVLATDNSLLSERIAETAAFLLSDMRTPTGLFTSAYDADSEGEEGKYYLWSKAEITNILSGHAAEEFCRLYGVTEQGNFEGRNILNRIAHPATDDQARSERLALARQELLLHRHHRIPPLHDDKSLADWNALTISAFAEAALVFGNQQWLNAAQAAHAAVIATFWDGDTLWHSHRAGRTQHRATANDYALLIDCTITLAGIAADPSLLQLAKQLLTRFEDLHWSPENAGFLLTARDSNDLPANHIPIQDDVTPSPNAVMARNYVRLGLLFPDEDWQSRAEIILERHIATALQNPFAAPSLLAAAGFAKQAWQVTLYGIEVPVQHALVRQALKRTGLDAVLIHRNDHGLPAGSFTICRGPTCSLPISNEKTLAEALSIFRLN
jgi:hypothetical protein